MEAKVNLTGNVLAADVTSSFRGNSQLQRFACLNCALVPGRSGRAWRMRPSAARSIPA